MSQETFKQGIPSDTTAAGRPLRVLQILPELNVGGVETGTVDFAKYLLAHGHYSVVVSNGGALVAELEEAEVKHYVLPVHRKNLWTVLQSIHALRRIILTEKIDIVHARSRVPAWIAYFACRRTPAEFLTTCHGYYSTHFLSRVMSWAKLLIVPSEVIGRHMVEAFGVNPEQIRAIPRSVDLDRFSVHRPAQPGKSSYVISIVGRITPLKGHTYFLRAMAKVVRSMPYVTIWIIGDTPAKKADYRQELDVLVRRLGLSKSVEFLGTRSDVPELLAQTDVLVLSSTAPEAFGRVILEAQAVGVPVVATKVGGVIEIIDHEKTGLLVEPKDPDGMAQAVLRLLNDRKLAKQMAVAATEKLKDKFTLEKMASRTIAVYRELMSSMHILVIKLSSLGDVILITASLKALRKKFPQAKIYCLVGEDARSILQRCPYIDGLIPMDLKVDGKSWWSLYQFGRRLGRYHFDKVIDFQNNRRSHILAALAFARESYGYANKKMGWLLSSPVAKSDKNLPPVEHQFRILEMLGIVHKKEMLLELWPTESDRRNVQKLLEEEWVGENANIVGINLAASQRWESKNWSVASIARLIDLVSARHMRVVLTGTEKDKERAHQVMGLAKTRPANLVGKTSIMELSAFMKCCKVYITPDSAPLHIAAAMKTPLIALFGPTSAARHMPPSKRSVIMAREVPCAPCYSPLCKMPKHSCMEDISPEDVAKQVIALFAASAETGHVNAVNAEGDHDAAINPDRRTPVQPSLSTSRQDQGTGDPLAEEA